MDFGSNLFQLLLGRVPRWAWVGVAVFLVVSLGLLVKGVIF